MRWLWPYSWHCRIRELEADNARLTAQNRELDAMVRAAAIQQISLTTAYTSAVASLASMAERPWGGKSDG